MTIIKEIGQYRIEIKEQNGIVIPNGVRSRLEFIQAMIALSWVVIVAIFWIPTTAGVDTLPLDLVLLLSGILFMVFMIVGFLWLITPLKTGCGILISIDKYGLENDGSGACASWSTIVSVEYPFTDDKVADAAKISEIVEKCTGYINQWRSESEKALQEKSEEEKKCCRNFKERMELVKKE